MRVLVIEDDPAFVQVASTALPAAGVDCVVSGCSESGMAALSERAQGAFDLVLLGLPRHGRSSWDVLMEVREMADEAPVICVTAQPPEAQDGNALELGADDCIIKPVAQKELLARVRAVVKQRRALPAVECGDLRIDLARRRVERAGDPIHLSPREYDLLLALVRADGKFVSREDLVRGLWGAGFKPGANAVEVHLGRLRRKVDRRGRPLIEAVFGAGYRLARNGHGPA